MVEAQTAARRGDRRWRRTAVSGPALLAAYKADPATYTPFFTPIGALLVGLAAFGQWRTARLRHEEQTNADRQRRITESFAKAVEQLGSDKLEVRLGGIYSLERISKESPDDYWMVMENLTAFVRERSHRNEAERASQDDLEQRVSRRAYFLWLEAGRPDGRAEDFWATAAMREKFEEPATDIVAVLAVITRRSEQSREREHTNDWRVDLRVAILKYYELRDAHLERAILFGAHLERAILFGAHLEGAILYGAHLEGAILYGAHLERAHLGGTHLEGTSLTDARLEGADLSGAVGLSAQQLHGAHGDAATILPDGLARPSHWPEAAPQSTH